MSGSTGLVGSALVPRLRCEGHDVVRLLRRSPPLGPLEATWNPAAGRLDPDAVEGLDAVVHLSGESLAGGRWTRARKRALRDSRVDTTRLLAGALARTSRKPRVWVSASAVGYYGDRGDERLTESSVAGTGFLATLCREWEAATEPASQAGIRVVVLRTGVVLTASGGALPAMLPVFRLGLGGPLGDGAQWLSWVTLLDLLRAIDRVIADDSIRGPVNAASPSPVRNLDFARALGRALGRPARVPVPSIVLQVLFGEMARETLLASQRAVPARLEEAGFSFTYPEIEAALHHVLGA
ncbi:MAG TPA: TIGR01777 family oxidoreductase [Candidatus Eisenbacteria bacterium]